MNDFLCAGFEAALKTEFGDRFTVIVGSEGKWQSGDGIARIRETEVRASNSTPALVVRFPDTYLTYLAGLDSEGVVGAMTKLRRMVRSLWDARLGLPYDRSIRGTEALITASQPV